jgi:dihydrofolate synthase/folylpolyglutamate synthase
MLNYTESLALLFSKLPMFNRIGAAAIKKNVDNTLELCTRLGNPQHKFKTIHIAGTNGKGSVSHIVAAILQTAGYKTGLYTSPHLVDFRERIKIDGKKIQKDFVTAFTNKTSEWFDEIEPSFFEITVAMAFDYFTAEAIDVAVVEVGLGGRTDSTNIITPEISIITNIGWDHMNLLGNTLAAIAWEKAGIIKHNIPVIIGETQTETKEVFIQEAALVKTDLFFADTMHHVKNHAFENGCLDLTIVSNGNPKELNIALDLTGLYQQKNIVTVLEAIKQLQLKDWRITTDHITTATKQVRKITGFHGRWEQLQENPCVIVDVGHNEDGFRQILEQLSIMQYNKLHIIIGMVKDKDVNRVVSLLPDKAKYYFTRSNIPRALPELELASIAATYNHFGTCFPNVNIALKDALRAATPQDLILICGSVFLAGEVEMLQNKMNED